MGKKVKFAFAPTGGTAKSIYVFDNELRYFFEDDVVRIYFAGCQNSRVGGKKVGGTIAPDLDVISSRIRGCFSADGELSLTKLKKEFGDAVIIEGATSDVIKVDDITLTGSSRGAVTTFAAARYLDDLNIPISLFAVEPVTGNSKKNSVKKSSEFYKNYDLRGCKNLRTAEILLGVYQKDIHTPFLRGLHNKYLRQMAPIFSEACNYTLSTHPKASHYVDCNRTLEHETLFLHGRGLINAMPERLYSRAYDSMFFVPKIVQQKYHVGVIGRTQLSKLYKNEVLRQVKPDHRLDDEAGSIKHGQALFALGVAPRFPSKDALLLRVRTDTSNEGKALREFIVEFENINQYVFGQPEDAKVRSAIARFRTDVYERINAYPNRDATFLQKKALYDDILACVTKLKGDIPRQKFAKLHQLMETFLADNMLFHPDLTQYLDETETYRIKVPPSRSMSVSAPALSATRSPTPIASEKGVVESGDLRDVNQADELGERLYHMSVRSRAAAYDTFAGNLPNIVHDANQLAKILRFLPPNKIEALLKKKETRSSSFFCRGTSVHTSTRDLRALMTNVDDMNHIMEALFTGEQRNELFSAVRDRINAMAPTFEQLGKLMQYLSPDNQQALIKLISLDSVHSNSSVNMITLFEKLSTEQASNLIPLLENKLAAYLTTHAGPDGGLALQTFLRTKVAGAEAMSSLDRIFSAPSSCVAAKLTR